MEIKAILYMICIPFSMLAVESINFNNLFKKNREFQSKLLFIFLSISLCYLVVNFFYDFFMHNKIL